MKHKLSVLAVTTVLVLGLGCAKKAAAPLPAGAINSFDATTYRALADAQAAINSFKSSVSSGQVTETPAIKTALNQVIQDYNSADALYQAYHASQGQTATAPIQTAVTKLQTDVNGLGDMQ